MGIYARRGPDRRQPNASASDLVFFPAGWFIQNVKKIFALLILAGFIITACMLYLVFSGVSLRPATLIRPSPHQDPSATARATAQRLFAEFRSHQLVLASAEGPNGLGAEILDLVQAFAPEISGHPVVERSMSEGLDGCEFCWIRTPPTEALDLAPGRYLTSTIIPSGLPYMTLNVLEFSDPHAPVPPDCETLQRLDLRCLKALAIRESVRKMKDPKQRYFFLRKYNHRDFFLFVQTESHVPDFGTDSNNE